MNHNSNLEKLHGNSSDKLSAVKDIIDIIENGINLSQRIEALKKLNEIPFNIEKVGVEQETVFAFFENLLVSDSNEKIREEAAYFLYHKFSNKALEPLKWALHHETSVNTLFTVFNSLISIIINLEHKNAPDSRTILLNLVNQIDDKDFKIGIEQLIRVKDLTLFNTGELSEILRNYFAHIYIKRRFWRVKYEIIDCKITELDFIFKGLSNLPIAIKQLTALKVLILRYNQITTLPEWLGDLVSLEVLNLNINNLISLPQSIGRLKHLKELLLWKNELHEIPNSIGCLSNLIKLNLRLNQLEHLPRSFGNLTRLSDLNLHDNKLKSLPKSFSKLESLEFLNLSWNSLTNLPESIGKLNNLKNLDLERNELITIPNSIGLLSSLEYLNLRDNRLRYLPESFSQLKNLKVLDVSRNKLEIYPEIIMECPNLKEVYLGENNLSITSHHEEILTEKGITFHL